MNRCHSKTLRWQCARLAVAQSPAGYFTLILSSWRWGTSCWTFLLEVVLKLCGLSCIHITTGSERPLWTTRTTEGKSLGWELGWQKWSYQWVLIQIGFFTSTAERKEASDREASTTANMQLWRGSAGGIDVMKVVRGGRSQTNGGLEKLKNGWNISHRGGNLLLLSLWKLHVNSSGIPVWNDDGGRTETRTHTKNTRSWTWWITCSGSMLIWRAPVPGNHFLFPGCRVSILL